MSIRERDVYDTGDKKLEIKYDTHYELHDTRYTTMQHTTQNIEALLMARGEPSSKAELLRIFACTEEELAHALQELSLSLEGRGVCLLETEEEVELRVAPVAEDFIKKLNEEELAKSLGTAAQETLAIILFRGPISRSRLEYIRGVGCQAILRSLLVRGLIIRKEMSAHRALYLPSTELLAFLGITRLEDLPEYEHLHTELLALEKGAEGDAENEHVYDAQTVLQSDTSEEEQHTETANL